MYFEPLSKAGSARSTAFRVLLGLETTNTVFRTDAMWRFTNNRRHRLDFTWFNLSRDGDRQIFEDITIEDEDGNKITIPAGTTAEGTRVLANGGRVLNVTARGKTVTQAQALAYQAVDAIDWPDGFCRRDIGWRAIEREKA